MPAKINFLIIVVICTLCICHRSEGNLANTMKKTSQQYPQHENDHNHPTDVTLDPSIPAPTEQTTRESQKKLNSPKATPTTRSPLTTIQGPPEEGFDVEPAISPPPPPPPAPASKRSMVSLMRLSETEEVKKKVALKQVEEKEVVETATTAPVQVESPSPQIKLNSSHNDRLVDAKENDDSQYEDAIKEDVEDEEVDENLLVNKLQAIKDAAVKKDKKEVELTTPKPILAESLSHPPSVDTQHGAEKEAAQNSTEQMQRPTEPVSQDVSPHQSLNHSTTQPVSAPSSSPPKEEEEEAPEVSEQMQRSTEPVSQDVSPHQSLNHSTTQPVSAPSSSPPKEEEEEEAPEVSEQMQRPTEPVSQDVSPHQSLNHSTTQPVPAPSSSSPKEEEALEVSVPTEPVSRDLPPHQSFNQPTLKPEPQKGEAPLVAEHPPPLTESPNHRKKNIGRGPLPSSRRQFTRPSDTDKYNVDEDIIDFEPYLDSEYHPVLATLEGQRSNEEVKRMMQQKCEEDLLLDEDDPISTTPASNTIDESEAIVNETTTTTIPEVNEAKMHVEEENQAASVSSQNIINSLVVTFLSDPTIIIYTLFCVLCLSLINLIKWFLRSKPIEISQRNIKPPVEVLGSQGRSKIKNQLEKEVKMLKNKNLLLTKRIQRLPVIEGRKEVAEKLIKAKSQLAVLRQYISVDRKNSELKKKTFLSKYNQVLIIQNFVQLEDLLELMKVIEFISMSHSLKESTFAMKVECDFLREQMSLFRELAKQFREDYQVLSNEIALEKKKESAIEGEYSNLKNLCDELDLNNSIDEWKRRLAAKETETDRYYKDYINNYYCNRAVVF